MDEPRDDRRTMRRREFLHRQVEAFPEAHVERSPSGELVIYTGWMEDSPGDVVFRWGEKGAEPRTRPTVPKVIIAGHYHEALEWCRERGINPLGPSILWRRGDEQRIRGMSLQPGEVERVGTWEQLPPSTLQAFAVHIELVTRR